MKNTKTISLFVSVIFTTAFFNAACAAETPPINPGPSITPPTEIPGTVNCFDYYKFGSVQVDVESEINSTVSGVPMTFKATIKNDNDYPVVDGAVYAKVFHRQVNEDKAHANGNFLVDQFFVQENISLDAKENKNIDFTWQIPSYALTGEYQIAMFFTSAKKFNLLGLSFTDDVVGNTLNFQVSGELKTNVDFNKNTVQINDQNYHFAAFPPRFKDEDIIVKAELVNSTEEPQAIPVTYKLYSWDGQLESNLIDTKSEVINLEPNQTKQVSYTIQDKTSPVYYMVIESQFQDTKSILDIRTVREDQNKVRINFPAITNYPLKQNQKNTLFVCAHNSGTKDVIENNKLVLTLMDERQNQIHQYVYTGQISGAMMGLKDDFTPQKDYANFTLKAELYTDNQLVDSAEMKYDCSEINKEACPKTNNIFTTESKGLSLIAIASIIVIIIIAVSLIIMLLKKKGRKRNIYTRLLVMGFVMAASLLFGGVRGVDAKSVVWNGNWGGFNLWYYSSFGATVVLNSQQVSVEYRAILKNASTGSVINENSTVPVGTSFAISTLHQDSDISWFASGYAMDSPYGYWKSDAGQPDGWLCISGNYIATPWAYLIKADTYASLSIAPPIKTVTYSGTASLSCDASKMNCKIVSPGTIKAIINFATTNAKWWVSTSGWGCAVTGANDTASSFIPAQSISYNISAFALPPANKAPVVNVVGPIASLTNVAQTFTATANDPENDTVRYGFDWDNSGAVDQWMQASGVYINSGAPGQVAAHSWITAGNKNIRVQACDSKGACAWSNVLPINITTPPPVPVYSCTGADPANTDITGLCSGDSINLAFDAPKTAVASCTDGAKCEYTCKVGFNFVGGNCVAAACSPDNTCLSHVRSPWFGCTATCGGGIGTEYATCDNGCSGTGTAAQSCTNNTPCPSSGGQIEVSPS